MILMRRILTSGVSVGVVAVAVLTAGCTRQSPSAMSQGQAAAILHELQEIQKLLEGQPGGARSAAQAQAAAGPQSAEVSIAGAHSLGSVDAPIVMVEFTDYQCPFCSRFARKLCPPLDECLLGRAALHRHSPVWCGTV